MGKLRCDSATVTDTLPPQTPPLITWRDPPPTSNTTTTTTVDFPSTSWDDVTGLEDQQRRNLSRLQAKGVLWKHPEDKTLPAVVFRLSHGGDVDADGNCLFSAVEKAAMWGLREGECGGAKELRRRTVKRFEQDYESAEKEERERVEIIIKNLYSPDLKSGWGIHIVQEIKLLANKSDRQIFDDAILELFNLGMLRETAAESIYKERCIAVDDGPSWAKYMSISGSPDDEYDIITLQYTEEGLLTVDENREGRAAAFGDDIAIECLSTEFKREIFVCWRLVLSQSAVALVMSYSPFPCKCWRMVLSQSAVALVVSHNPFPCKVQAHGSDAMVDEDNCVFFLPHRPRGGEITGPPLFLFMKGTGWCGAGADHYEPLIAHPSSPVSQEKVGFVL